MSISEKDSSSRSVLYVAGFISEVEINSTGVALTNTNKITYFLDKDNTVLLEKFNIWFKSCYLKAVPHSMTVIKYHVEEADGEPKLIVDDLPSWTITA